MNSPLKLKEQNQLFLLQFWSLINVLSLMASIIQPTSSEPRSSWIRPSLLLDSERESSTMVTSSLCHAVPSTYQHACYQYMNRLAPCATTSPPHIPTLLYRDCKRLVSGHIQILTFNDGLKICLEFICNSTPTKFYFFARFRKGWSHFWLCCLRSLLRRFLPTSCQHRKW